MRLCVYQGTFNPPHFGHLKVAEFVMQNFNLDKIIFVPAAIPPHKHLVQNNGFARVKMTELLVENHQKFEVSDIEFKRKTPSYTVVTLKEIYKLYNLTEKPYFIIGDDAFLKIETWYHTEELKDLVKFIVLPRDDFFNKEVFDKLREKGYDYIRLDEMPKIFISSSEIRKRASKGSSLKDFTTQEVEKYIYDNKLYQNDN